MSENYHLTAIEECKSEFRAAIAQIGARLGTSITAAPELIDAFAKGFENDFSGALTDTSDNKSPTFPENAWALTRTQVLLKVQAIAALATSYALERRSGTITEEHLKKAVLTVKPDCETTTRRRLDYCPGFVG